MDTHALPGSEATATGDALHVHVCGATFSTHAGARTVLVRRDVDGATLDTLTGELVADLDALRHVAERWLAERIGTEAPSCTQCRSCGMTLGGNTERGPLVVTLHSGYGQYLDEGPTVERTATICAACVDELRFTHPWITELLETVPGP